MERTRNISSMVLTLDVSKFSGWLNVDAPCAESNRGHKVGRDPGRQIGVVWGWPK